MTMPVDASYEPDPTVDLSVPPFETMTGTTHAAHYWLLDTDPDYVARVRSDAEVCARRTGKRQRLHYHRADEPCADEVHQDVEPPRVSIMRPGRGPTFYTIP